jgi:hypothetical protein
MFIFSFHTLTQAVKDVFEGERSYCLGALKFAQLLQTSIRAGIYFVGG